MSHKFISDILSKSVNKKGKTHLFSFTENLKYVIYVLLCIVRVIFEEELI